MESAIFPSLTNMKSPNKLALVLIIGFTVVVLGCHAQQVTFRARTRAFFLTQDEIYRVLSAILNRVILSIDPATLYHAGRSFTLDLGLGAYQVNIRVWFFSTMNRISNTCSVNPIWTQLMRGQEMRDTLANLYAEVANQAFAGCYGRMEAVLGSLGIQYSTRPALVPKRPSQQVAALRHRENITLAQLDDEANCWVYSSCLINGDDAALGSYLPSGGTLVSNNGLYKLIMQKDCNLVLYYVSSAGYIVEWASNTGDKGNGCYANLQMDGNLVLVDSSGSIALWASNRYCQPQPNCIVTTGLVVQDDGNVVIYDTDEAQAFWSIY